MDIELRLHITRENIVQRYLGATPHNYLIREFSKESCQSLSAPVMVRVCPDNPENYFYQESFSKSHDLY